MLLLLFSSLLYFMGFFLFVCSCFFFFSSLILFHQGEGFKFFLMRIFIEIHKKLPTCFCFMRDTITINLRLMTYNFTLFSTVFQSVSGNESRFAM